MFYSRVVWAVIQCLLLLPGAVRDRLITAAWRRGHNRRDYSLNSCAAPSH